MNVNPYDALLLPTDNKLLFLNISSIIRIEASSNYSKVFCKNQPYPIVVAKVLRWFEEQPVLASFLRIHRTHLVNPHHIKNYRSGRGILQLQNDEVLLVARRRKLFLKYQLKYLNSPNTVDLSFIPGIITKKIIAA